MPAREALDRRGERRRVGESFRRRNTVTVRSEASPAPINQARMLAEAAALFRQRGYARTTMRQLGESLGIRGPSLYHHIAGKEELLHEICVRSLQDITEAFRAVAPDGEVTAERIRALFHVHVDRALGDQDMHATMLTEFRELSSPHRDEVLGKRAHYEHLWQDQLAAGQERGVIRADIDVHYLTLSLLNMLNWSIFWYRIDGELTTDELADVFFATYFEGAASAATPGQHWRHP